MGEYVGCLLVRLNLRGPPISTTLSPTTAVHGVDKWRLRLFGQARADLDVQAVVHAHRSPLW
jgi:hypothetical protein